MIVAAIHRTVPVTFARDARLAPRTRRSSIGAALLALMGLGLAACSGAGGEFDEDYDANMELGELEAALQNDGSGPVEDKCTTAWQGCYLDCTVTRYPESKDSPSNFNEMMREGCLDSCDAANRTCTGLAMTRPSLGFEGVVDGVVAVDPRPAVTKVRSAIAAKPALQLAR